MNRKYKKIIILMVLFVAIAGFSLAPASATTKTVKVKNWEWIGSGEGFESYSGYIMTKKQNFGGTVQQKLRQNWDLYKKPYKNVKITVVSNKKFKKVVLYYKDGGKSKKLTSYAKKVGYGNGGSSINYKASKNYKKINNYKPYKYIIYY